MYITPVPSHTAPPPGVTVTSVTSSHVVYETTAHDSATRVIAGYEVIRFGVPMIGEYENTGRGRRVTISLAVPGAQYRITAGELNCTVHSRPAIVHRSPWQCPHHNVTVLHNTQGMMQTLHMNLQ